MHKKRRFLQKNAVVITKDRRTFNFSDVRRLRGYNKIEITKAFQRKRIRDNHKKSESELMTLFAHFITITTINVRISSLYRHIPFMLDFFVYECADNLCDSRTCIRNHYETAVRSHSCDISIFI